MLRLAAVNNMSGTSVADSGGEYTFDSNIIEIECRWVGRIASPGV
jgi:hypothetical protein